MIGKHVHNNRESREGQVLRYIRESRKLSLTDVAHLLKLKAVDVDHFENGRRFYSDEDVSTFLKCYEFSREDFDALMALKVLNKQIVNHWIINKKSDG